MKIKKNNYYITSDKIPSEFNGFKITHISDLHNRVVDKDFYNMVDGDIIVLTGDLISRKSTDISCVAVLNKLSEIAPVYYITGNHEGRNVDTFRLIEKNISEKITILHDEMVSLNKNGKSINLIGLDDLNYLRTVYGVDEEAPDDRLEKFSINKYTVVLIHSPNNIEYISQYKPDLVLCGHTHGGQICLPVFGAIYAPGQGLFPKYTKGLYNVNNVSMIINAGIGYSRLKIRTFCPPEINSITLHN